jgi:RNA polymerase sigma-70 factor, ECF subfamily
LKAGALMEADEKGLLQCFMRGDRTTLEQIIRLYGDGLFGYLMKMSGDRETAEDYFQETFSRVCEKAGTFRGGNLRAWIFRIATNVAMDGFRKEKRQPMLRLSQIQDCDGESQIEVAQAKEISDPSEDAQRQEEIHKVQRIIEELPAGQRTMLVLSFYQRLSYAEVAEVLNCSIGTVKTQMYRALKKLAAKLPDRDKF